MSNATLVSEREGIVPSSGAHSVKKLYRLDPPIDDHEYVVVSSVSEAFDTGKPETMVFAADKDGEIVDWADLAVARNSEDHAEALSLLGYEEVAA